MNWKMSSLTVLLGSTLVFGLLTERSGRALHLTSQDHILDAVESIALSMGFIGRGELRQGGHRKVLRVLGGCLVIWFAIDLILFGIAVLCKTTMLDLVTRYTLYPLWLTFAAPFPFALYLNRRPNESNFPPTIDNAN